MVGCLREELLCELLSLFGGQFLEENSDVFHELVPVFVLDCSQDFLHQLIGTRAEVGEDELLHHLQLGLSESALFSLYFLLYVFHVEVSHAALELLVFFPEVIRLVSDVVGSVLERSPEVALDALLWLNLIFICQALLEGIKGLRVSQKPGVGPSVLGRVEGVFERLPHVALRLLQTLLQLGHYNFGN